MVAVVRGSERCFRGSDNQRLKRSGEEPWGGVSYVFTVSEIARGCACFERRGESC